jgi:uncharacterized membrane protein
MDPMMLAARALHILLGVFWAGTLIFNAIFLLPAIRDAGPEGGKVAAGLMQRRFLDVMPWVALLTVVTGFYLYWRLGAGSPAFFGSRPGMVYGMGGVLSVLALVIGVGVVRPAMLRAASLTRAAVAAAPPERDAALAMAQGLRARAAAAGRWVAWLLAGAVLTMAVGRYV